MSARLAGKAAFVTAAGQGIGRAAALAFAREGAKVWASDMNAKTISELKNNNIETRVLDATDEQAIAKVAVEVGDIDVLVNNAGIAGPAMPVVDYPIEEWKRVIDIDLTGPFLCCRAVVPHMTRAGYGRIVNIASVAGKEGNPNAAAYGAAKGGLITFTKSLGKELAQTGVLVNCVTPAAAQTAILEQVTPEFAKFMLSKIPMGRFAKVEEIAALACWLASEDCSFTTGGVFDISGGRATY